MPEKILIISYLFPPSKGIGGRRWAKIAKHWDKEGNDVEVIASKNKKDNGGPWNKDIEQLKNRNKIHYIEDGYPKVINSRPKTILQKLHYRIALLFLKLKVKGNYYDRSVFWEEKIMPLVIQKINDGFTSIAATGAPFFYLKSIVGLKKIYPDLKVWVDLRDPWTWGSGYGMNIIGSKRKNEEKQYEKFVVLNADLVSVPVKKMYQDLSDLYSGGKIKMLPHFYDPADIPTKHTKNPNFDLDIIYAGTVYDGIEKSLLAVADELLEIKGRIIRWRFFVSNPDRLTEVFVSDKYNKIIEINAQIQSEEIQQEIFNSDFYMAIYPDKFKDHLSTKFPELYILGVPIIFVGHNGEIANFILQNSLGVVISLDKVKSELNNILLNTHLNISPSGDKYSINNIIGSSFSKGLSC